VVVGPEIGIRMIVKVNDSGGLRQVTREPGLAFGIVDGHDFAGFPALVFASNIRLPGQQRQYHQNMGSEGKLLSLEAWRHLPITIAPAGKSHIDMDRPLTYN